MTVRRLRADEVEPWRALRLAALLDSPRAFGATHEQSLAMPAEDWASRVVELAESDTTAMFVADCKGALTGSAGVYVDPEEPEVPHLFAMWVAPSDRRRGTGRALVGAALAHARRLGATKMRLHLTRGNKIAAAFYERCGFQPTGAFITLTRDCSVVADEMQIDLGEPQSPAR